MTLGKLLEIVTFILVGLAWLSWVSIDVRVLGGFAFATGVVMLLEALSVVSVNVVRPAKG